MSAIPRRSRKSPRHTSGEDNTGLPFSCNADWPPAIALPDRFRAPEPELHVEGDTSSPTFEESGHAHWRSRRDENPGDIWSRIDATSEPGSLERTLASEFRLHGTAMQGATPEASENTP
jgi:hypothetical protein